MPAADGTPSNDGMPARVSSRDEANIGLQDGEHSAMSQKQERRSERVKPEEHEGGFVSAERFLEAASSRVAQAEAHRGSGQGGDQEKSATPSGMDQDDPLAEERRDSQAYLRSLRWPESADEALNRIASAAASSEGHSQQRAHMFLRHGRQGPDADMDVDTKATGTDEPTQTGSEDAAGEQAAQARPPRPAMPNLPYHSLMPPKSSANMPMHLVYDEAPNTGEDGINQVLQAVPKRPLMPVPPMMSGWHGRPMDPEGMPTSLDAYRGITTRDGHNHGAEGPEKDAAGEQPAHEQSHKRQTYNALGSSAWDQTLGDVNAVLPGSTDLTNSSTEKPRGGEADGMADGAPADGAADGGAVDDNEDPPRSQAPKTKEASTTLGISENVEMPGMVPGDQIPGDGSWTSRSTNPSQFEPRYRTVADDEYAVLASAAAYATAAMTRQSARDKNELGGGQQQWEPLDQEHQEQVASCLRAWAGLEGPQRQAEAQRALQDSNNLFRDQAARNDTAPVELFPPNLASHYQTQLRSIAEGYYSRLYSQEQHRVHGPVGGSQRHESAAEQEASERRLQNEEDDLSERFRRRAMEQGGQPMSVDEGKPGKGKSSSASTSGPPAVTTSAHGLSSDMPGETCGVRRPSSEPASPDDSGKRRRYSQMAVTEGIQPEHAGVGGAASDTRSMAFPTVGPPQVPIVGWSSELEAPVAPLKAQPDAEDPVKLLHATASSLGKDIHSPEVRDELLQYAHQLYSSSVARGEAASEADWSDTNTRGQRPMQPGTKLHPTLLPVLHMLHKLHKDHLPTLLLLSCAYYTSGNLSGSLWYNNLILRIDPNYVEAMSNIGTALRALGYWKEAESWWWRALQLLPGYWDAFENLLGVLCSPSVPGHGGSDSRSAQFETALRLCEYVEAHIIPARGKLVKKDDSGRIKDGYSAGTLEPQALPTHLPLPQLPRIQNLFYAKGNLKYVIEQDGVASASQEYQRAIEVTLSNPLQGVFSVRDVLVSICVVGILSFGAVVPGMEALSTAAETASALGIDLSNPSHASVVSQGQYMRLHPYGLLGLVRDAGDTAVEQLMRIGGGQMPVVLLLPDQVTQLNKIIFAPSAGVLPVFQDAASKGALTADSPLERVSNQASQISSTILLALAKLFQDSAISSNGSSSRLTLRGVPPSISLLLPFYYFSLSLNASASTYNNLGILLSSLHVATTTVGGNGERVQLTGQLLAVRYYAHGLQLDPKHSHLFTNLGSLFKDMGRLNKAVKMYEKAVEYNPTFDVALANLGNAIKDQGRTQDSIAYYRRSVQANPHFPEALSGLVNALLTVTDWKEVYAEKPEHGWMDDVIAIVQRQLAEGALYGRGAFRAQGSLEQWVDRIMQATGDYRDSTRKRWAEKLAPFYDTSSPDNPVKEMNEGGFMLRLIDRLLRRTQHRWYLDQYKHESNEGGDAQKQAISDPSSKYGRVMVPSCLPIPAIPTVLPFHTFTYPLSPRQVRLISHRNALRTSHCTLSQSWLPRHVFPPPPPPADGKLNIGYLSSDFNNHPLAHLMQSVFGFHDLSSFNVYCYSLSPSDNSPYRTKIEQESQHFIDVSNWTSQQIIEQVLSDKIHILVNLNGYTKGARSDIFAARPCPVQMQFMGFAGGMAAGWTDWLVVDPIVCPPEMTSAYRYRDGPSSKNKLGWAEKPTDLAADLDPEDKREDWVYTERFIYMPHSYFVNDHAQGFRDPSEENRIQSVAEETGQMSGNQQDMAASQPNEPMSEEDIWRLEEIRRWRMRKELFPTLPDDYVIFADFNQLYKTDPVLFKVWLSILSRVPNSILWLLRFPAAGESHLRQAAEDWAGPEVASRVIFTDVAPKHIHIYRGRVADLFLDTNECNAHTTAADILWSGTPILTWPKHVHKMCSRVTASIARATGLGERMVVNSKQEYEDRAVELATQLHYQYKERNCNTGEERDVPAPPSKSPGNHRIDANEITSHCSDDAVKNTMSPPEGTVLYRRGEGELIELRHKLFLSRDKCPLFDTRGWVRALEAGYKEAWRRWENSTDCEDSPEWESLPLDAPEKRSGHIWLQDPDAKCMT